MSGSPLKRTRTRPDLSRKRRLVLASQHAMQVTGAGWAYARVGTGSGVILMYHSVADERTAKYIDPRLRLSPQTFERQIAFLSRHRHVVSIDELVTCLESGRRLPPGTVAITFDDGYRDNLAVAGPVLHRYRLPATLYLPTASIDRAETHWVDRLYTAFATRTVDQLRLPVPADETCRLEDPRQQLAAYRATCQAMIAAAPSARDALLANVIDQLRPMETPPRLTMNWDEIRKLVGRYPQFQIGAHTVDHVDLSTHSGPYAWQQIEGAARAIEAELDVRPTHFSFPYARHSEETRQMVREAGFRTAVSGGGSCAIGPGSDLWSMTRIDPPQATRLFKFQTSGAYPGLPLGVLGRA